MLDTFHPQSLINSGGAWRLEGSCGRACMSHIENGTAILGPIGIRDYWGNYVPSRTQVKVGSIGRVQYANKLRKARGQRPLRALDFDNGYGYDGEDEDE